MCSSDTTPIPSSMFRKEIMELWFKEQGVNLDRGEYFVIETDNGTRKMSLGNWGLELPELYFQVSGKNSDTLVQKIMFADVAGYGKPWGFCFWKSGMEGSQGIISLFDHFWRWNLSSLGQKRQLKVISVDSTAPMPTKKYHGVDWVTI